MGNLAGLTKSYARTAKYKLGGVAVALGFNTFTDTGLNQASVDDATGLVLTVAAGATIVRLDFEENTAMFSDDTKIGNNRYPEHMFGFKLGGRSNDLNELAKTFDLKRTTFVLKTHTGECVVVGLQNGLVSSQNKSGAGAGTDDFNGFDVVLSGGETAKALVISKADFDALAARVV